jgi:hypothetical protein
VSRRRQGQDQDLLSNLELCSYAKTNPDSWRYGKSFAGSFLVRGSGRGQVCNDTWGRIKKAMLWRGPTVGISRRSLPSLTYAVASSNRSSCSTALLRSKPCGGSKFKVQEFKVIMRPVSTVPAVPNVQPLRSVQSVSGYRRFQAFQSSKPHGSSRLKGSTFNDQTPSDSSRFSGILVGMRHEETGKS